MALKMNLPYPVRYALNTLRRAGHQAYCVGGCVRDSLLGVEPNDFDLTTSALPEEMERILPILWGSPESVGKLVV